MKKHKLNWVDALVIAVVVLLIVGTALKFLVLDPTAIQKETVDFSYTLRITGMRHYTADTLRVGDVLYDGDSKTAVGVIEDVQLDEAHTVAAYPDGSVRRVAIEDRYDAVVTVRAQGIPENGVYKVGSNDVKVNRSSIYFTKYATWTGRVIALDEGGQ